MWERAYLFLASYLKCWHFVPPLVACEGGHPPSILPKGGAAVNKSRPKKVTFRLSEDEHRHFIQIPTSLLSQVDSSVGGKTGVDLPTGKNLVGAFWQPSLVLIDPETLKTLPDKFFRDGLGEVVKYGCIRSSALFERLENENAGDIIDDIIFECISIKRDVVQNDERDTGESAILNFGHTFGHALEKLGGYTELTHGEAVAAGSIILTRLTESKGITEQGTSQRLEALLGKYGLPTGSERPLSEIIAATRGDKKSTGKSINFVFLKKIGECFTQKVPVSEAESFFGA